MRTLYWAPRTRSIRALWILEESGEPYERIRLDLSRGEQKTAEFRAINPMGKVPALTDGPLAVAESGAICAYVAEACPKAQLAPPLGDPARGRYLQWLFFSPGCIESAYLTKSAKIEPRPETAGFGDFNRVMDVLDAAIAPGPWLLGERFSAADVLIGADLYFGVDIFKLVAERPVLRAYIDRCLARPLSSAPRRSTRLGYNLGSRPNVQRNFFANQPSCRVGDLQVAHPTALPQELAHG